MKFCSVEGCGGKHNCKGYCQKHYVQVKKYGGIVRTRFVPNEFIIEDNICWVILYNRHGVEVAIANRDEMLRRRGFGGRSLAAGPTKIEGPTPVSGPVKVAAPDIHVAEGPHAVDI